jgi:soluble lytic murein transglycosylase-like protein
MSDSTSGNISLLALAVIVGVAIYAFSSGDLNVPGITSSWPSNWLSVGACYVPTLNQVETQYGLPTNLLCAVAYQESTFNPNAYNCSSGATGMFQLLPSYYPNAGQSWQTDAATAAQALAGYYTQFGNWQDALAAYNWGPGNLSASANTYCCLPSETQTYVSNIVAAVPAATGCLVS